MIRLTRKVFTDLAIWMLAFGFMMGVIFPFFVTAMGIPSRLVLTPWFFAACITAGLIVGGANVGLARAVVGSRLRFLAERMRTVTLTLQQITQGGDASQCTPEHCHIPVDSEDEIGESARSFNDLVSALSLSLQTEAAVAAFTETLASQLDLDTLTDRALQQLLAHTAASAGAILIESDGEMKLASSMGIRSADALVKSDHVRRALRMEERQSVLIPEDVIIEGVLTDFRPHQVILDPVLHKDVILGVILLASTTGFTHEQISRLDLFRRGLALALHNALLYDRLQRLAALDPLTGAYNRRFGLGRLHEEFGRAVRVSAPLGLLLVDIDHFKQVNDTYGHLVGDRVLARISSLTRSVIREGDILVRYGGEEFLVVLPAAAREDVRHIGERLRRMVEEAAIVDGDQVIRTTISLGGTAYPETDVASETDLVRYADKALYSAKESGRNRVVIM